MNYREIIERHKAKPRPTSVCVDCGRSCKEGDLLHETCLAGRRARRDMPPAKTASVYVKGAEVGGDLILSMDDRKAGVPVFTFAEVLPLLDREREDAVSVLRAAYQIKAGFPGAVIVTSAPPQT